MWKQPSGLIRSITNETHSCTGREVALVANRRIDLTVQEIKYAPEASIITTQPSKLSLNQFTFVRFSSCIRGLQRRHILQ